MKKVKKKEEPGPRINTGLAPVVRAFRKVNEGTAGKLFSCYGLKVKSKIFAMYGRNKLVVKLPKSRVDAFVSAGEGGRFHLGHGRLMKQWIAFEDGEAPWMGFARG